MHKVAGLFVSDGPLHLTLREMRETMTSPLTLAILAIVAMALGISGPFGTYESLSTGPRLAYWVTITFTTFVTGDFIGTLFSRSFFPKKEHWLRIPLIGVAQGVAVTGVVLLINILAAPGGHGLYVDLLPFMLSCIVIATGITLALNLISERFRPENAAVRAAPSAPILDRLPPQIRGPLIRMTVEDHYVEVETVRGKHLLLMRLADAIKETGDIEGLQVHRSHWVARQKIAATERREGKWVVVTTSGEALPVSRTYLPVLREKKLIA